MDNHRPNKDDAIKVTDKRNFHSTVKFSRQFSTKEAITELFKQHTGSSEEPVTFTGDGLKKIVLPDRKIIKTTEEWDLPPLYEKLSKTSTELLNRSPADYENTPSAKEVRHLEGPYKNVTEKFLVLLARYLKSVKDLRQEVIRTLKQFRMVSRVAANVTLGTSITNVVLVIGALAQKFGNFPWHPRISLISSIVAGMSFTASLLTISYMRQTTTDVARDMRREKRVLLDLLTAHRKGDWIDEKVERLFPFGVDLNFIDKKALETSHYFENRYSWKKYLSSAIILSNIYKDLRLLDNDRFLTTVKLFVESPAAEIWWSRIKIRNLLEKVSRKADILSTKQFLSAHESHVSRTALYLYPLVLPWLVSSWNSEEIRFLCSIIAGLLALSDLRNDSEEELKELRAISSSFQKDFQEIETICEILDSNDD